MPEVEAAARRFGTARIDLGVCAVLLLAGLAYLWPARHWAATVYAGGDQWGDARFWWEGALHFSRGIIADNPNLLYRMGYAAFAGAVAAVLGPNYLVFHKILLALFLALAAGLYSQLKDAIGRAAAAAATALLVFNPYTAEWLAVSSSDSLGMIFNLGALLALGRAMRRALVPSAGSDLPNICWLAVFGALLALASLTRPLMTLMIIPAAVLVLLRPDGRWRTGESGRPSFPPIRRRWSARLIALAAMVVPFFILTFGWMALIGALSGNFALSGASQDSSIFYSASDPRIQVWRPDIYPPVEAAARRRFHVVHLTPRMLNREFWQKTLANYQAHWRHHLRRLPGHIWTLASFTPDRGTAATPSTDHLRLVIQLAFAAIIAALCALRARSLPAAVALAVGLAWAMWPPCQGLLLLIAATAGMVGLGSFGFIWASYWWIGVLALYLTGGTWGPPLTSGIDLNALGYRLGFQFFFAGDILICGGLARVLCPEPADVRALPPGRGIPRAFAERLAPWLGPRPAASRCLRLAASAGAAALGAILLLGAGIASSRLIERSRTQPVPYPALSLRALALLFSRDAAPATSGPASAGAKPGIIIAGDIAALRAGIDAGNGARLATTAMSSGFVWNLPGQDRCLLYLYQQDAVRPVRMMPDWFLAEASVHLPEDAWRMRQGAWVLRSFPDFPIASNQPYYFEAPAIESYLPLSPDGRSFDFARAVHFPLAQYATQLAAAGELTVIGATPIWAHDSGGERYPRRFGLRRSGTEDPEIRINLGRAEGNKTLRFGWNLEGPDAHRPVLELTADAADDRGSGGLAASGTVPEEAASPRFHGRTATPLLWRSPTPAGPAPSQAAIPLNPYASARLTCRDLAASDTLWLYELVLTADDFSE